MRTRPARTCAAAALALALAAGCSGSDGPVDEPSAPASGPVERARCVVADPEGEVLLQPGTVRAGPQGLRFDPPTLADGLGLDVVGQWVVPYSGAPHAQGVVLDYPPLDNAGIADGLATWSDRRPTAGLQLRPDDGLQALLVALRLSDPDRLGHLAGTTVTSHSRGTSLTTYQQPLLIKPHGSPCTVDDPDEVADW